MERAWHGLRVVRHATRVGEHRLTATDHVLALHTGRAVQARCRLDGRAQRRIQSRGDLALVPAGAAGTWHDDQASEMAFFSVDPAFLRTTAEGLGLDDAASARLVPRLLVRDAALQHLAWAIEAELDDPFTEPLYGDSLATALAVRLLRRHGASAGGAGPSPRGLDARQLGRIVDLVRGSLASTPSLAALAAEAGVSVPHFQVLFRRSTGLSVHRWVVRERVEHARDLLVAGAAISDAAARSGFCDASHLSRWLVRLLGVTPSELAPRRTSARKIRRTSG